MLDILKRMNNLQYTEQHQRICYLFSIFNLTCYKFVVLKENTPSQSFRNHYSYQILQTPQSFSYGCHCFSLGGGDWGTIPLIHKILKIAPFCWIFSYQKIEPLLFFTSFPFSFPRSQITYLRKVISNIF